MKVLAIGIVLAGLSVSGMAQQSNEFKVKHSSEDKQKKTAALPIPKTAGAGSASSSNSKELQALEHQSAKTGNASHAGGNAGKKSGPALKPVKDKPNPPINFNSSGAPKGSGGANGHADPNKGRVRQKGKHQ